MKPHREPFPEGMPNYPSPFPLPPKALHRYVANATPPGTLEAPRISCSETPTDAMPWTPDGWAWQPIDWWPL